MVLTFTLRSSIKEGAGVAASVEVTLKNVAI
jgi:hypothetical protein